VKSADRLRNTSADSTVGLKSGVTPRFAAPLGGLIFSGSMRAFSRSRGGRLRAPCYFRAVTSDSTLNSTLLIAMPQLEDPNFRRSVMLIVEHSGDGTFGLVLNRSVDLLASTLCASLDIEWHGDPEDAMQWGGPVEPNTGWLLLNEPKKLDFEDPSVSRVGETDLFLARSIEVLRSASDEAPGTIRFYLGYAGWGPGQLESEMEQGAWLVAPLDLDLIFNTPADDVWDRAVRGLGIEPATLVSTQGLQ
jgi:putative transcriptional regulator